MDRSNLSAGRLAPGRCNSLRLRREGVNAGGRAAGASAMPIECWHRLTEMWTRGVMRPRLLFAAVLPPIAAAAGRPPSASALCEAAIVAAEHAASLPPGLLSARADVEGDRTDDDGA